MSVPGDPLSPFPVFGQSEKRTDAWPCSLFGKICESYTLQDVNEHVCRLCGQLLSWSCGFYTREKLKPQFWKLKKYGILICF